MITDDDTITTEEQATLDQMRADEAAEVTEQPVADTPEAEAPAETPAAEEPPAADGERQKTVPHAALHEERERRKETERQLADERKARQTLEERTNLILQRFSQPQQEPAQPAPLPDREKDPVAYLEALGLEAKRDAATAMQAIDQRRQQDQQAQVIATIQQHATAGEAQFRLTTPDYNDAAMHLVNARHQELELAGWTSPAERQAVITQEALGLAARALQERRNPAEVIYALAKQRGYSAPQANEPPPALATEERLAQIDRGQQQSRSLGSVRGGAPPALTAQRLAEMPEAEFNKMIETPAGKALLGA